MNFLGFIAIFVCVCVCGGLSVVCTPVGQGLRLREEARVKEVMDTEERLDRARVVDQERADRLTRDLKGRDWVWGKDGEVSGARGGGEHGLYSARC